MKGIYSGTQILQMPASEMITRSQTASQARHAIKDKYGMIRASGHYYHAGKGIWNKWSLENDRKRTGKLAETKAHWSKRPHKLDWEGIDTKGAAPRNPRVSAGTPITDKKKLIMSVVTKKTGWKRRHIGQDELQGALYEFTDGNRRYRFTNSAIEVYVPKGYVTAIAYNTKNILHAIRAAEKAANEV